MKYYIIYDQDIIALFWKPEYIHHFKKGNMKIKIVESYTDALEWIDTFYKKRESNPFELVLLSKQNDSHCIGAFRLYYKNKPLCTLIKKQNLTKSLQDLNYYLLYRAIECSLQYSIQTIVVHFNFTSIFKRLNGQPISISSVSKIFDNEIREMRQSMNIQFKLLSENELNTDCQELLNKQFEDDELFDYDESVIID